MLRAVVPPDEDDAVDRNELGACNQGFLLTLLRAFTVTSDPRRILADNRVPSAQRRQRSLTGSQRMQPVVHGWASRQAERPNG